MQDDFVQCAKNEKARLERIARDAEKRLRSAPSGQLRVSGSRLYLISEGSDAGERYIKQGEIELARALAQKAYDKRLIAAAKNQAGRVSRLVAESGIDPIREVYDKLSPVRKRLVTPCELSDEEYAAAWSAERYDRMAPPEDASPYYTNRGETVRSKSEVIIANLLDDADVPYRYEQAMRLCDGYTVHPDFTILKPRSREIVVWEHFGLMGDPDYRTRALRKISAYERSGFTPGRNFIATFESEDSPLDTRAAHAVVAGLLA